VEYTEIPLRLNSGRSVAQQQRFRGLYPGGIEPAKQFQLREDDRFLDRAGGRKAGIEGGHCASPESSARTDLA